MTDPTLEQAKARAFLREWASTIPNSGFCGELDNMALAMDARSLKPLVAILTALRDREAECERLALILDGQLQTWVDADGTIWAPASAMVFADACTKSRDHLARAETAESRLTTLIEAARPFALYPMDGQGDMEIICRDGIRREVRRYHFAGLKSAVDAVLGEGR